jgi:hypothetical protein
MLRFGLGFAIALGALSGMATAQTAETAIAASESKPQKSRRSHEKMKATETAQPGMVPPLPERKTAKASPIEPPPPDVWTTAEIDAAKVRCAAALKGLDAVVTPEPPIKEGSCGTPAPIRLSRLGSVTFTPAALINCGMLAPLNTWITKDLQPAAQRQLGGKIAKIEVMSDYSCRTAFGRVGKKLSQHAYVDALDIRGFVTANGQEVAVLSGWGVTNRDIAAAAAAAKAKEEKLAQAQADAVNAQRDNLRDGKPGASEAPAPTATAPSLGTPGTGLVKSTRAGGIDKVTVILSGSGKKPAAVARLGGPDDKLLAEAEKKNRKSLTQGAEKTAALSPDLLAAPPTGPRARFLREAHAGACRIFGTTLGPEANEAHRNHFHVDMAERKVKNICD